MEVVTFHPNRVTGLVVGSVGLVLLLGLDVVFLLLLPQPPLGFFNFLWGFLFLLSLPPIGLLAYRTYNLGRSAYRLGSGRLIVEWGARREVIPVSDIQEVLPGREVERDLRPSGVWWPGCIVGRRDDDRLGRIEFLATMPQDGQVFVVTDSGTLALSPEDLEAFTEALTEAVGVREAGAEAEAGGQRSEAGDEPPAEAGEAEGGARRESIQPVFTGWEVWGDRWAVGLMAAGLLAVLALFAFVLLRLPGLPVTMPLHFTADGTGTPDRTGAPRGLLILPLIGLLTLLVNGALGGVLHIRAGQRTAAYLLWGCAVLVQALVWIATLGLMARA